MDIGTGRVSGSSEVAGHAGDQRADRLPHWSRRRRTGYKADRNVDRDTADAGLEDGSAETETENEDEQQSHQLDDTA